MCFRQGVLNAVLGTGICFKFMSKDVLKHWTLVLECCFINCFVNMYWCAYCILYILLVLLVASIRTSYTHTSLVYRCRIYMVDHMCALSYACIVYHFKRELRAAMRRSRAGGTGASWSDTTAYIYMQKKLLCELYIYLSMYCAAAVYADHAHAYELHCLQNCTYTTVVPESMHAIQ